MQLLVVDVRKLGARSRNEIERIHEENYDSFPLPDLDDPFLVSRFVVIDEYGEIVSVALARKTTELILITDFKKSKLKRARALQLLVERTAKQLEELGYDETNALVMGRESNQLVRVLRDKLGFIESKGRYLGKNLREKIWPKTRELVVQKEQSPL